MFLIFLFSVFTFADQPKKDVPKPLVMPDFSKISNETKDKPQMKCTDNVTGRVLQPGDMGYDQCTSGPPTRDFMPRDQNTNQTFKGF